VIKIKTANSIENQHRKSASKILLSYKMC